MIGTSTTHHAQSIRDSCHSLKILYSPPSSDEPDHVHGGSAEVRYGERLCDRSDPELRSIKNNQSSNAISVTKCDYFCCSYVLPNGSNGQHWAARSFFYWI